ncbi:ABC transporter ATP-binding protein [Paenibacillus silvae]|uniref:ABC transporter ATP-binding protein n=1 Tax=Paenibacillus silvae TaxID=1325358 RepID=UPI0020055532|nr:ABC transporter ATP-binding protein [Paenibacillus silvae]MCK6077511.1 ABC transporter ATP-binding protein/permease [Paenibacillus silvae]MCK6151757.1 ABC transporter ATP-binding protein/permease [Paenibacillus silvae]MCK6270243.1 ABC transporter ATP-binding protein/permease [Paenibacillus silvae]
MVRKLLGSIREYTKDTWLTPLFLLGEVAMEVVIPLFMAELIDQGITGGQMNQVVKYGLILVLFALVSLVFGVLAGKHSAIAMAGFGKNLRYDLFRHVQQLSYSNMDKFSTSGIVTRLTTDITHVQNAFLMIIRIAFRSPVMMIFATIMTYRISPTIAMWFVIVIPVLAIGMGLIMKYSFPIFERAFGSYDDLNKVVQENVRGIRVVKSYVREEREISKFQAVSEKIFAQMVKAERILSYELPLMQIVLYAVMLIISWIGAKLVVSGSMTTGELTSVFAYSMQILMSLMTLGFVIIMMAIARASAGRINDLLSEQPDIISPESPITQLHSGEVQFRNVSFRYSDKAEKYALSGINLHIRSGQTVGIIGASGSAKSTMVQLIPRLYDVSDGEVLVSGTNVKHFDLKVLRDQVAMVLQRNVLFEGTIKENLRWGNEAATDEELVRACKAAQAHEFISAFPDGYDTHLAQGGTNVSGGQKQRLCIARALLKKPKILILDDSTSAVDTRTDALIRGVFKESIPDTTKIIIAQRIASVEDADQIIVLHEGRMADIGTHQELLRRSEIYQEAYHTQTKGGEEQDGQH